MPAQREASDSAAPMRVPGSLGKVARVLEQVEAIAERVGYPDSSMRHEFENFVMMILGTAYNYCFGSRADLPLFVPWGGMLYTWAAANPDDTYRFVAIDGRGTYRISGVKGSPKLATLMMRLSGPNTGQGPGPSLGEIDMTAIEADGDGRFSFLLSAERPPDGEEPWHALDPRTTSLFVRQVFTSESQRDGVWCIERLDTPAPDSVLSEARVRQNFAHYLGYVPAIIEFILKELKVLSEGPVNSFAPLRYAGSGGMPKQMYFTGFFDVAEDEALVIESPMPDQVEYVGVQLFDRMFNTLDFYAHQSSLNQDQFTRERDGSVRLFLAPRDPGFANWLDTGGATKGGIMWRWHTATSFPEPRMNRVKAADLVTLYPESAVINRMRRQAIVSERSRALQSRRRW